ncbi:hypothetical protein J6590_074424 [Homalodisca vitripennis]|nr:hypothetical protein J6590_074424 [Homalodisca vitripennis]
MTLQKKWKNIKDSYAREKRRLSGVKSGSAAERKTLYVFYNTLTFLNTNNPPTNTHSNVDRQDPDNTDLLHLDIEAPAANPDPTGPYETRVLAKKRKPKDEVGQQLVKILKDSAEERRNREIELTSDEDRLFLMSLVSDLKRVPEHLKLSVKRQLMAVLEQNQGTHKIKITSTRLTRAVTLNSLQATPQPHMDILPANTLQLHYHLEHLVNTVEHRVYPIPPSSTFNVVPVHMHCYGYLFDVHYNATGTQRPEQTRRTTGRAPSRRVGR